MDVIAYGPSLHDSDSCFLMRAFPGIGERQRSEDAFYASEEWRNGPREAVLAAILSYTTIVIQVDGEPWRPSAGSHEPSIEKETVMPIETSAATDLAALVDLNQRLHPLGAELRRPAVQRDPRRRFPLFASRRMLIDRARFLEQTARRSRSRTWRRTTSTSG